MSQAGLLLEPRTFTAYFYRLTPVPFDLLAGIVDIWGNGNPSSPINSGETTVVAEVLTSQNDNLFWQWIQSQYVINTVVDSGSYISSATDTIAATAAFESQGTIDGISGPGPFNGNVSAGYSGYAASGPINPFTNLPAPIVWQLATPDAGGAPTNGALPGTPGQPPGVEFIEITFHIEATVSNPDFGNVPLMTLTSNNFVVNLNDTTNPVGLLITDPTTATVLYADATFGAHGQVSSATVPYTYAIPTVGPYNLFLQYYAQQGAMSLNPNSVNPDTSWYQDTFEWSITFHAVE